MFTRCSVARRVAVFSLTLLPLFVAGPASRATPVTPLWSAVGTPTGGPPRVIGHTGSACIAGAVPVPLDGAGYQVVDVSRRRTFGHPALVGFIGDLGRAAASQQLGTMLVGDLAQPRGGPMSFGHVSHQGGLDVDIWFRLESAPLPSRARDGVVVPSVVDPRTGRVDPARWTARHAQLIRLAAQDPRVSRVFVGAAIKRDLCQRTFAGPSADTSDRGWLRIVRPWPGHDDHLHVRLRCPQDSPACVDQPPLPPGDGCSPAAIEQALVRERAERHRPPPTPNRNLPAACSTLLTAAR